MSTASSRTDLGPIWSRPEPGARRARHTREQIAEAALSIADTHGFEAVSMRRVAAELGAGTMTLYHYVRTKDELVELMNDAIMGEVLVPDGELSSNWREAIGQVARSSHAAFQRHPWSFEALQGAGIGPNGLRHFEQSLEALAGLDASPEMRFEILLLVDDYVFGYIARWLASRTPDDQVEASMAYLEEAIKTGDYPSIVEVMGGGALRASWERFAKVADDPERFERGLQRLLEGIARDLER